MLTDKNAAYINNNGKPVSGTAAMLNLMFGERPDTQNICDRVAELNEYKNLIQQLGYANFEE